MIPRSSRPRPAALAGDGLLVRLAGKYEKRDGYGTNLFTGNPVDNRDSYSLRGTLVAKLSDTVKATLIGDYFHEDDNNYAFHYFGGSVVRIRRCRTS